MGQAQSSRASKDKTSTIGKKSSTTASARGRKSTDATSKQWHKPASPTIAEEPVVVVAPSNNSDEHTHSTHLADGFSATHEEDVSDDDYETDEEDEGKIF